jgi:hypothetical protein
MANIGTFNANEHEKMGEYSPIPNGTYLAAIIGSEKKTAKDGVSDYVEFIFQITEGEYKGRRMYERCNLWHASNEQARDIAKRVLATICEACGTTTIRDTAELHGIPIYIVVKVEKRKDTDDMVSRIKTYQHRNAKKTMAQAQAVPAQASAPTQPGTPKANTQATEKNPW